LFISRQLTELQGGQIGVTSEAGSGSTFAFFLKSRRADADDGESTVESRLVSDMESKGRIATTNIPSAAAEATEKKLFPPKEIISPRLTASSGLDKKEWHVLIVEDNLVNQKILAAQIKKLGCTAYVANHGGEALEILRGTKHYKGREQDGKDLSVILMDLEMPIMDGLTCVRKIRSMEAEGLIRGRIPIMAVTANARGEQIVAAKDSGMVSLFDCNFKWRLTRMQDDVMAKPFRMRDLVPKIEALLQKGIIT